MCDSTKIFCAGPYPKFTVWDVVGCEETSGDLNPEKAGFGCGLGCELRQTTYSAQYSLIIKWININMEKNSNRGE